MRRPMLTLVLFLAVLLLPLLPSPTITSAQTEKRCFAETNFCIEGRIRQFWEQNGGLPVFGFPITEQREEPIEGKPFQVQWFERNRLELHPENQAPYDVLIGRLGDDRLKQQGRDWNGFAKSGPLAECRFFPETNQSVCGAILQAWRANGLEIDGKSGKTEAENLALFGLPLSGLQTETLSDGQSYQVQWFERARFELHPENQAPYTVLLGLLGREIREFAPAAPSCTPPQPSSNGTVSSPCIRGGDELTVVGQGFTHLEPVKYRAVGPNGTVYDFAPINGDGLARQDSTYHLTGAFVAGVPEGVYEITMTGRQSGVIARMYVRVEAGPPTTYDHSQLPSNTKADATPRVERRGKSGVFSLRAYNMTPKKQLSLYARLPDGSQAEATFVVDSDKDGNVTEPVIFVTNLTDMIGVYVAVYRVMETGEEGYAYFRVLPDE